MTPEKVQMASDLMKSKSNTVDEICKLLGVGRTTLYRYVAPDGTIRKTKGG